MSDTTTATKKKRPFYKKKKFIITAIVLVLLIAGRIYLPYFVKDSINKSLADIPGYYGQIDDVHINLWRGAYKLENLYLDKVDAASEKVPFLNFPLTDISVQWRALLDGKVVSEIVMTDPEVTYFFEDHVAQDGSLEEPATEVWTDALTEIVPLEINRFQVVNGRLEFIALYAQPNIDLFLTDLDLEAKNLRNAVDKSGALPSDFYATATSIGNGRLEVDGKINLIKEIPDMNINVSLEDADIRALNSLTEHYAGIDFESGQFELYSELAIADSYMTGYFKPFFIDSKIVDGWDDPDSNIFKKMWEGFVGMFKFILKNQGNDTLATRVPIEGPLDDAKTNVLSSVLNVFENGWFNAFDNSTEDSIGFEDAQKGDDAVSDREQRKLDRQERREKRKIRRVKRRAQRRNSNDDNTDDINVEEEIEEIKKS